MTEPLIDLDAAVMRGYDAKPVDKWPAYGGGYLDRKEYVTASEIGYCARKIKFDKMAATLVPSSEGTKNRSSDSWGFFERGHSIEAWFVGMIRAQVNYPLHYAGKEQVSFADGFQSGTPDGVFFLPDNQAYVLEVKSVDPRTNWSRLPKLAHVDQVIQNVDLAAMHLDMSPAGGVIRYICASDYKKQRSFHIDFNNAHADALQARAKMIMEANGPEDLEPEGLFKDHCKICSHTAACTAIMQQRKEGLRNDKAQKAAAAIFGK